MEKKSIYRFEKGVLKEKRCASCCQFKTVKFFGRKANTKSGLNAYCKPCQTHKYDDLRRINRALVIKHYGSKCRCCGERNIEFPVIDHVNNNGAKHRRDLGKQGTSLSRWLIKCFVLVAIPKNPPKPSIIGW